MTLDWIPAVPTSAFCGNFRDLRHVFLSYTHVQPDEGLADQLCARLTGRGLAVFQDKQLRVGDKWAEKIERRLRSSDAFVVLLSETSIRSDMVRQEILVARKLSRQKTMGIYPVWVNFAGELPYDLAAYLGRFEYSIWTSDAPIEELCDELYEAIVRGIPLPEKPLGNADPEQAPLELPSANEDVVQAAPLPRADPRIVMEKGTIRPVSHFYVLRPADHTLERQIATSGTTTSIWGQIQSGKSSMIARARALAEKRGQCCAYVDFETFEASQRASLSLLLQTLAFRTARSLAISVSPEETWNPSHGAQDNFEEFLEQHVLPDLTSPLVLFFDGIDWLLDESYSSDFFSAVRGWHNNRANISLWENLNLVFSNTSHPSRWIARENQSPFNVAEIIAVGDFSRDQVEDLNRRHGRPLRTTKEIEDLLQLTGGQPYLVRQALYTLVNTGWSLDRLKKEASRNAGPFGDHLQFHLLSLLQIPKLRAEVINVLRGKGCRDEQAFQRLWARGLISGETRGEAHFRCHLYQIYFRDHL